ncbi:ABC-F type ribosomal protection protein OptrA, partial [Enterococcus faecalis]
DKDGVEFVQSTYGEYEKKRLNSEKPFNNIKVEQKVAKNNTVKGDRNSIEKEKVKKAKRIEKLEVLINQYDEEFERLNKIISEPNNSSDYIILTEIQK